MGAKLKRHIVNIKDLKKWKDKYPELNLEADEFIHIDVAHEMARSLLKSLKDKLKKELNDIDKAVSIIRKGKELEIKYHSEWKKLNEILMPYHDAEGGIVVFTEDYKEFVQDISELLSKELSRQKEELEDHYAIVCGKHEKQWKEELKEVIKESGQQQDDDTIWCDMGKLLKAVDNLK